MRNPQKAKVRRLRRDLQPVLDVVYQMRYDEGFDDGIDEGKKLGIDEGKKLGIDEGKKLGIDEGNLKASLRIASELLADGMSPEKVARITKLDESQVAALMQKNGK